MSTTSGATFLPRVTTSSVKSRSAHVCLAGSMCACWEAWLSGNLLIFGSSVVKTIVLIFPTPPVTSDLFYCTHSLVASSHRLKAQNLVYVMGCSFLCLCLLPVSGSFPCSCSAFERGREARLYVQSRCRRTMDVHTGVRILKFCGF